MNVVIKVDPYRKVRREIAPPGHIWISGKEYRRDAEKEEIEKEIIDGLEEYGVDSEDMF